MSFTVFQSLVCATPHASFSSGQSHSLLFHLFALSPPIESLIWEVINRLKLLTSFVSSAESPAPDLAAGRGGETTGYSGDLSSVPCGHGHAAWQLLAAPSFHIQVMLFVPLAHFLGHCKAQREKGVEVLCKAFS